MASVALFSCSGAPAAQALEPSVKQSLHMRLPDLRRLPSWRWWAALLGTLPASISVGIGSYTRHLGYGIIGAGLWVLLLARITWPGLHNRQALEDVLSILPDHLGLPEDAHVRCAIYVPLGREPEECLLCITNYMPEGTPRVGKVLPISKGIIGEACRFGETRVDVLTSPKFADRKEFQRYLMRRYSFTEQEAKELQADRRANLASPVRAEGNIVLGVIYMDSDRPEASKVPRLAQRIEALAPFFYHLLRLKGG
jgi:hypothetical protein